MLTWQCSVVYNRIMLRHSTFPLTLIFTLMEKHARTLPSGECFKPNSPRLILFKTKGADCVICGARGSFFALESHNGETPHMNLYAHNERAEEVLMTKDHIIPKAHGGENILENYQPMCEPCNGKKADKLA